MAGDGKKGGWSTLTIVLVVVGGLGALGCCGIGGVFVLLRFAGEDGGGPLRTGRAEAEAEAELPWLEQVSGNCERYESAPNDIKRSEIFNENEALLEGKRLDGTRASLTRLYTSQGGDMLDLGIEVGDATFKSAPIVDSIEKGDPLYRQASTLQEGQCVIVRGEVTGAASLLERSKVCDLDYFLKFESIEPCP